MRDPIENISQLQKQLNDLQLENQILKNILDQAGLSYYKELSAFKQNENKEAYTKVNHVPLSSSHLGIVAEVNELSREISAGRVKLEEAEKRLDEIEKIPPKNPKISPAYPPEQRITVALTSVVAFWRNGQISAPARRPAAVHPITRRGRKTDAVVCFFVCFLI